MLGKLANAAARAVTVGAVAVLGAGSATAALAAPSYITFTVPCSGSALYDAINNASSGDTLVLKAGCIYQLDSALPDITRNLTINGHGATVERSYNGSPAQFSIFTVTTNANLTLINVNVRNGSSTTNGGGVDVQHGSLYVLGGVFSDNTASDSGGAIYVSGNTTPSIRPAIKPSFPALDLGVFNTVFHENSASYGGAIETDVNDPAAVLGSHFDNNSATNDGGAYYIADDASLIDNHFTMNTAGDDGGGVYVSSSASPTIATSDFNHNKADDGGGLYNNGTVTVHGGVFASNYAHYEGGAVNNNFTATFDGTTFKSNYADDGGAFYNEDTATLTHTKFVASNEARYNGGAIYNDESSTMTVGTSTITNNVAGGDGGGIYNAANNGDVVVSSSYVADNRPDNCAPSGSVTGCTG